MASTGTKNFDDPSGLQDILKKQEFDGSGIGKFMVALYVIGALILVVYTCLLGANLDFNIRQYKQCIQKPSATDVTFTCPGQSQADADKNKPYYLSGTGEAIPVTEFYGVFDNDIPENL
jgi:hypothetical protein